MLSVHTVPAGPFPFLPVTGSHPWWWLAPGRSGDCFSLSWHQDHFLGQSLWTLANSFGLLPRDWVYTSLNEAGI